MFTIFLNFISLLDAFDFADTNTMQDVSRIIYETRTGLVHSRESLSQSVGTRNPKVWDLIPRGESKFSSSYAYNEAQKRFYSLSLADTFFNILLNISSQLLENTCVIPTIRGTKIYTNNLPSLRNVAGNLNAYFKKCSLSKEKKPKLNAQSDSFKEKLFSIQLTLSTFHILEILNRCKETLTRFPSIKKTHRNLTFRI